MCCIFHSKAVRNEIEYGQLPIWAGRKFHPSIKSKRIRAPKSEVISRFLESVSGLNLFSSGKSEENLIGELRSGPARD